MPSIKALGSERGNMIKKSIKFNKNSEQNNLCKINSVQSAREQKQVAQRFYKIICKMLDIKINNNPGIDLNYHSKNWSSLAVKLKLIINRLKCNQDKNNTIH